MCLYPKLILNRKFLPNQKNGGNPPVIKDPRTKYVPIGCGKCMECLKQRSRQWQVRLQEEIRTDRSGKFITMSFSDKSLIELEKEVHRIQIKEAFDLSKIELLSGYELENEIATLAIRRFLERYRKEYGKSVKHWLVTELGQQKTERIHIHGIIFTNIPKNKLEEIWQYGNLNKREKDWKNNYVTERTVNYIVKYINKPDILHKEYKPKVLTSQGIGKNYINRPDSKLNTYRKTETNEMYYTRSGIKLPLPIYYRNKIYNDEQKEELWINLLNKQKRYVNGVETDVSQDEEDYYRLLNQARVLNRQLGYGNDSKNWERKAYEQQRRNLKRIQRIEKERNSYPALSYDPHNPIYGSLTDSYKQNKMDDVYRHPLVPNLRFAKNYI